MPNLRDYDRDAILIEKVRYLEQQLAAAQAITGGTCTMATIKEIIIPYNLCGSLPLIFAQLTNIKIRLTAREHAKLLRSVDKQARLIYETLHLPYHKGILIQIQQVYNTEDRSVSFRLYYDIGYEEDPPEEEPRVTSEDL